MSIAAPDRAIAAGLPGSVLQTSHAHAHAHPHGPAHAHPHPHGEGHGHPEGGAPHDPGPTLLQRGLGWRMVVAVVVLAFLGWALNATVAR